jgi:hypothetical protein
MEYICDNIVYVIKFEKLHTYLKTTIVGEIFGWIVFIVNGIAIHELNLGPFINRLFWDETWKSIVGVIYLTINA